MAMPEKEISEFPTRKGVIRIRSSCTPEEIRAMCMPEAPDGYARYKPIISSKQSLIRSASEPGAHVTIACRGDRQLIVGFAVLRHPDPSERWHRVGDAAVMEVSVVEVRRPWRGMGVSTKMLECLLDFPLKEALILYMVGYSWTWDIQGTGLTAIQYRNMMIGLFAGQDFKTFQTNESNVMMRPENLFMARIGDRVPASVQRNFKLVRFDMDR